ncbi:riboflavin kinase [Methanocaldococcus villosus KIN24-T80]|uniref:Riboflavin kinase n=1 Tax=Methanocaldococcus villosus KIN24-T80 TaxID=1069083 RepID=N6VQH6_9EURY|nr:CTP-dependent riboflavin kinase [Methanocaldococcus villosus]ENN96130.1 riboflavin kinase [Methanocaldococcus villosus KIN24-T80]
MIIKGKIISGKGEGRYYLSIKKYKKDIRKLLNFEPYEGTLNLKLNMDFNIENFNYLETEDFILNGKKYFGVRLLPVKIKVRDGVICGAIISPKKTDHGRDVIEIIAPIKLREKYNLKDGDVLEVVI